MKQKVEFEKTITFLLARVTTAYRNSLEDHMSRVDLHGGQVFVLMELWREDGLRSVDIAKRLNLKPPTVTKMVNGLVEINLVRREALEGDARSTHIFLTDQGHSIQDAVNDQWVEMEAEFLSGLTDTERLILPELLGKLRNAYTGRKDPDDES